MTDTEKEIRDLMLAKLNAGKLSLKAHTGWLIACLVCLFGGIVLGHFA